VVERRVVRQAGCRQTVELPIEFQNEVLVH
jgi:hypothetical protein